MLPQLLLLILEREITISCHAGIGGFSRLLLLGLNQLDLLGSLVAGLDSGIQHDLLAVQTGLGSGFGLGGVQVSHQGGSRFFADFPPDLAGLDNGALQFQLLLAEGIHMVHLRRAVDGQLADELDALGVKVVNGRDFALLLVVDALAFGIGQRVSISLLARGGLPGQPVFKFPRPFDGGLVHALNVFFPAVQDGLSPSYAPAVGSLQLVGDVERRLYLGLEVAQTSRCFPGSLLHFAPGCLSLASCLVHFIAGGSGRLSNLTDGLLQPLCSVAGLIQSLGSFPGGIRHLLHIVGGCIVAQLVVDLLGRPADLVQPLVDLIQSPRVGLGFHTYLYLVILVCHGDMIVIS